MHYSKYQNFTRTKEEQKEINSCKDFATMLMIGFVLFVGFLWFMGFMGFFN